MSVRKKNNKGFALPFVLIIMLALTFLGTAFWNYSSRKTINVVENENTMQAYYLARSGAEIVAQYIIDNPDEIDMEKYVDALVDAPKSNPTYISDEINGYFEVDVIRDEDNKLIIKSTGTVNGISETVSLSINEFCLDNAPLLDMAVFANSSIQLKGDAEISGNAGTNSTKPGSINLDGNSRIDDYLFITQEAYRNENFKNTINKWGINEGFKILDSPRIYELPPFPIFPQNLPKYGDFSVESNDIISIYENGEYESITVKGKLVIHVGNENRILVVDDLKVNGNGEITIDKPKSAKGRLYLYVRDNISLSGNATVNKDGDRNDIIVYYKGIATVDYTGNNKFVGCLYAKKADIKIAGNGGFTGHIITGGKSVDITGNANANVRVLYAPYAEITNNDNGDVIGAIVCDSYIAKKNAIVKFDDSIEDFLEFWGGTGETIYEKGLWQ